MHERPEEDDGSALASNDLWVAKERDNNTSEEAADDEIGKNETRAVFRLKLVVCLVLITSTIAVALSTYFYISLNEDSQFRTQFEDDAHKIFEAVGNSVDQTLGVFDTVGVLLATQARATNQTWPFVTVPHFALFMAKILPPSAAITINVLPIVTAANRDEWEVYTSQNDYWVNEGMAVQETWNGFHGLIVFNGERNSVIHGNFENLPANTSRIMLPMWQNFPVVDNSTYTYNYDWASSSIPQSLFACIERKKATFSRTYMIPKRGDTIAEMETEAWAEAFRQFIPPEEEPVEPAIDFAYPILDVVDRVNFTGTDGESSKRNNTIVGILGGVIYWRTFIRNILPEGSVGIRVVFTSPCNDDPFTYQIDGPKSTFVGVGDAHDTKYDGLRKERLLYELNDYASYPTGYSGARLDADQCPVTLALYPSDTTKAKHTTTNRIVFTVGAILIFAFTSFVFLLYDMKVERRQDTVLSTAVQSSAIVSSFYPAMFRDRLYPVQEPAPTKSKFGSFRPESTRRRLQTFLDNGKDLSDSLDSSKPIAELFPDTTVFFSDIAGFTAWSSERQPTQVFVLLETLYAAFDKLAKERGVFKLGTIGDAYVAVIGLPTPRKHHAAVMALFAADCRTKMNELTDQLEKTLGPGTSDLALRFGLHSGPTTAGVLRGDKSRFELFGDTVNTASRMESNGERNKIQVSEKTAELIKQAGKGHWLIPREDKVNCKGKGLMSTYWCEPSLSEISSCRVEADDSELDAALRGKRQRLIDWNTDTFKGLLQEIVLNQGDATRISKLSTFSVEQDSAPRRKPWEEVSEVLMLPQPSGEFKRASHPIQIPVAAMAQLRLLVADVARLCRPHLFHNFEHGSHAAMAAVKLLDGMLQFSRHAEIENDAHHGYVQAITSDPLTRFAIVYAALVRDIDHPGVSNEQLVSESHDMAVAYDGKGIAEQNAVDVAWRLLMEPKFSDLRRCMFIDESEVDRFRQVLVNGVMATDPSESDLQTMRKERWETTFQASSLVVDDAPRRTAIAIELILQVSVVSYTMQHFAVYEKWNHRLLAEVYAAYQSNRTASDPLTSWYNGQLSFFDMSVIPLATKLKDCGVFGSVSDEFLNYTRENRAEWQTKGLAIVQAAAATLNDVTTSL